MNSILPYHTTPIQQLSDPVFVNAGIGVFVKREDINHPTVSGNKWWKLKYNVEEAIAQSRHTLLTFGGAYSNHIYATAAAAQVAGLRSIGIIRGEEIKPLNETLSFASAAGMQLYYLSRDTYRRKDEPAFINELTERFGRCHIIPEGGSNELGVAGVAAFAETLPSDFDFIICPVGTGATLAGLIRGRAGKGTLIGVPVLKGGDAWIKEVEAFQPQYANWRLFGDYHFGGYAKSTPQLEMSIRAFAERHGIPTEHIYSAKMFFALYDLAAKGFFKPGANVLALHTGGIRTPQSI